MKVLLHGATGRMGRAVIEKAAQDPEIEIVEMVSPDFAEETDTQHLSLQGCVKEADVCIDFSNHASTEALMNYCIAHKLPVIVCTTGQTEEEKNCIEEASKIIPVFSSGNMSLGIAVLQDLAKRAAAAFPDADIEIIEKHHNQKLDVPSGTALMLACAVQSVREAAEFVIGRHENGKRRKEEIGIHSIRMGNEVGTHEIIIASGTETITIKHEAETRALFADGAIIAAKFMTKQPAGLYNMQDVL